MSHQLWSTLIKWDLSPNLIYFLDCCSSKIKPSKIINSELEFKIAQAKGYITDEAVITDKGLTVLDEFKTHLTKTKKKVASEVLGPNFIEMVNKYRELFPAKRFPSGELARQSSQELKDKFVWFFKTYPDYNWDLVLDATDYYLHLKQLVDYQYAITSSYFIKKTDPRTKETRSVLADYCQQILDDPDLLT